MRNTRFRTPASAKFCALPQHSVRVYVRHARPWVTLILLSELFRGGGPFFKPRSLIQSDVADVVVSRTELWSWSLVTSVSGFVTGKGQASS